LAAIDAGLRDEEHLWDDLLAMIADLVQQRAQGQRAELQYTLVLSADTPLAEQEKILVDVLSGVRPGGRAGGFSLFLHPRWKRVLQLMSVNGQPPRQADHLDALLMRVRLELGRQALRERWTRQVEPLGAPTLDAAPEPERTANEYVPGISSGLAWARNVYRPLEKDLVDNGLLLTSLKAGAPPNKSDAPDVLLLRTLILDFAKPELERRYGEIAGERAKASVKQSSAYLSPFGASEIAASLLAAITALDKEAYRDAYSRLVATRERTRDLDLRRSLLAKLERVAPAWALAVEERRSPHDLGEPPGDPESAWTWRQLDDELDRRGSQSLDAIQAGINELSLRLERTTAELVGMRAWARQIERTTPSQQASLVGYMKLIRKIGKGTGKKAPMLKLAAQRQLGAARESVPVWIMPLSRVVDSFQCTSGLFDVVIVDEASQSDLLAYIALYLGKQVVVVGDDQQVTPEAIGVKTDETRQLVRTYLQGIPNSDLYDGESSIYDLAEASFGGTTRLTEHFRCAPDIISFSNALSYNGEIKPLRDPGGISLRPHVREYRVRGSKNEDNFNQMECEAIASLVAAAIEQPEYRGKTFGVISLLGTEQARQIEAVLLRHIPPMEYESRRILCGSPAHFQGDERDVTFLSMVYGPQDRGPLGLLPDPGERFKKRFNVAASRAKDQMWLVHSLDPDVDLKPGDLRKRLIDHVRDPRALERDVTEKVSRAESPFEKRVLERLVNAGYGVTPQYKAGYYRIDIVVTDQQIAIECDGDRYHTQDNLREDVERQTVLERLGWRFIRIRGTKFYRDPDGSMASVFDRLGELGAEPRSRTQETTTIESNELIERVTRRAAEIRAEWGASSSDTEHEQGDAAFTSEPTQYPIEEEHADEPDVVVAAGASERVEPEEQSAVQPRTAAILEAVREKSVPENNQLPLDNDHDGTDDPAILYARTHGLRIADRRDIGGALWIVGGSEHEVALRPEGFSFAPHGGRASGHEPAWYRSAPA